MEGSLAVMIPLVGVILSLAIPIVAIIMVFVTAMHKKKQDKEVRQLIIENHTDAETAKLLIDEPKKQPRKMGPVNRYAPRCLCITRYWSWRVHQLAGGRSY